MIGWWRRRAEKRYSEQAKREIINTLAHLGCNGYINADHEGYQLSYSQAYISEYTFLNLQYMGAIRQSSYSVTMWFPVWSQEQYFKKIEELESV